MAERLAMLTIDDLGVTDADFVSPWSGGNGGNCLEEATADLGVAVRDSKLEPSPTIIFRHSAYGPFLGGLAVDTFAFTKATT